ncbi:YraN family protein [Patescibacteria group bacterium]|nr:YraN family protein [Patescibacteria group bacterium]
MKDFNLQTGRLGEGIAKEYLEKKGYNIIEQNYRTKYAEIDLVAKQGKELVFVEVRTKRGDMFGTPEDSLSRKKMLKLRKNAWVYVAKTGWKGVYQIDAICIVLKPDNTTERLEHYENIV